MEKKINIKNIVKYAGSLLLTGALATGVSFSLVDAVETHNTYETCMLTNVLSSVGLTDLAAEHQMSKIEKREAEIWYNATCTYDPNYSTSYQILEPLSEQHEQSLEEAKEYYVYDIRNNNFSYVSKEDVDFVKMGVKYLEDGTRLFVEPSVKETEDGSIIYYVPKGYILERIAVDKETYPAIVTTIDFGDRTNGRVLKLK